MSDILVVDDDGSIASAFQHFLRYEGHEYRIASDASQALELISERVPDLVFMDVRMPGRDGLQTLQEIRSRYPNLYVVIMTAYGTSQTSIDAIRSGAFDYVTKPLDLDQLRAVIDKASTSRRVRDQTPPPTTEARSVRLVGDTPAMHDVYKLVGRLAATDVPALIVGERGTGKRLVARTIHENSSRAAAPFKTIEGNDDGVDVERALAANPTATLYVAAIDRLAPAAQVNLAAALIADASRRASYARTIASTEADLGGAVRSGQFNSTLFEALSVVTIRLPPLRDRKDDIPLLVRSFIQRFNEELARSFSGVADEVARDLQGRLWPGNVGELERVVKRACIVARSDVITVDEIVERFGDPSFDRSTIEESLLHAVRTALQERLVDAAADSGASPFHDVVDLVERELVKEALAVTKGNQVKAAEILGVNRATLRKKMSTE